MRRAPALVTLSLLIVAALPMAHASSFTVTATNFQWSPTPLQVAVGDTVTFTNGGGSHNFVSDAGQGSCSLPCTISFTANGQFPYHCGIHGSAMSGTVTVGAAPTITIDSPAAGATLQGQVLVQGNASSAADTIASVHLLVGTRDITATLAAPGATATGWSAALDTTTLPNGAATLLARATSAGGLKTDASLSVRISNPATTDIAITAFNTTQSSLSAPRLVYTLVNAGNTITPGFELVAQYQYKGTWRTFAGGSHGSLTAGERLTEVLAWHDGLLHVGTYPVRLLADPKDLVAEIDETNNEGNGTAWWYTNLIAGVDPGDP